MCGIVGGHGTAASKVVSYGMTKFIHRGPDHGATWSDVRSKVILGHRRLSILDLSEQSNQPFTIEGCNLCLVFNGEIYNHSEIRKTLIDYGHTFLTTGDTEVLYKAYLQWGTEMLHRIEGMWAFCFYDFRDEENPFLFLSRDRFGEKPLYYSKKGQFLFSSELGPLKSNSKVDLNSLNYYLYFGYFPPTDTLYDGISKLQPGYFLKYSLSNRERTVCRYWQPPEGAREASASIQEVEEHSWDIFVSSVERQILADVPVGLLLSGGLDSSLVLAAASQLGVSIQTFTAKFAGSNLDESDSAREIASFYNTSHAEIDIGSDIRQSLNKLIDNIDEPFGDMSIVPSYVLCNAVSQHVKVILGGDGGDEIFGGYNHYLKVSRFLKFHNLIKSLGSLSKFLALMIEPGVKGRGIFNSLQFGAFFPILNKPFFDVNLRKKIFSTDVLNALGENIAFPEAELFSKLSTGRSVYSALRDDIDRYLPDDILFKTDRASMYNSIEMRSPYLSRKLLEYVWSNCPPSYMVAEGQTRRIQKLWAQKRLPHNIQGQRKQGFSIPSSWVFENLDVEGHLSDLPQEYFDKSCVNDLISGYRNGRSNSSRMFALMTLGVCLS